MKNRSPLQMLCYLILGVLLVAALGLFILVADLNTEVQRVRSLTPTPIPNYGSSFKVTPDPSQPTAEPVIRSGSMGEAVTKLQTRLLELGYYTGTVDGLTGPGTKAAVKKFQQQNGLDADGVCGPATAAVLFSEEAKAVQQTPAPDPDAIPGVMANGYPILVNDDHHIPEDYEFKYLVNMKDYCDSNLVKIKGSDIQGEKFAVDALMVLLQAAKDAGHTGWQVNAGYRSIQYQQELFDNKVYAYRQEGMTGTQARAKTRQTVADPGSSEHHTGLAFDVAITGESAFGATRQSVWLKENCWDYGFIIRYPADKTAITRIS